MSTLSQGEESPTENNDYEELWSIVKSIVWIVKNNWKLPDKGIWEFRNEDKHFTFSKLLKRDLKIFKVGFLALFKTNQYMAYSAFKRTFNSEC